MTYRYAPAILIPYLAGKLSGVRVGSRVPNPRPAKLVTISTAPVAGGDNVALSWRRVVIHVRAATESETANLAEQVRDLVWNSQYDHIGIRGVRIVGEPADFRDPDDGTERFQITVDVRLRNLQPA